MGVTKSPEFLWAQRKDRLFLTVNVPNVRKSDAVIKIEDDGTIYFKGMGGNTGREEEYVLDIKVLKAIKASESEGKINARTVTFKIIKAERGPYWERLLKSEAKNIHCKIDWDNWNAEEEDEDEFFSAQYPDDKDHQDMDFISGGSTSEDEDDHPPGQASSASDTAAKAAADLPTL